MPSDDRKKHWQDPERNRRDAVAASSRDPLYKRRDAAKYLDMSVRQLADRPDIPCMNIARPGSRRPQIRYRLSALDAFIAQREAGRAD